MDCHSILLFVQYYFVPVGLSFFGEGMFGQSTLKSTRVEAYETGCWDPLCKSSKFVLKGWNTMLSLSSVCWEFFDDYYSDVSHGTYE